MGENNLELKLYSPLTAHFIEDGYEWGMDAVLNDFEGEPMDGYDLVGCDSLIRAELVRLGFADEPGRGFIEHYGNREPVSVNSKVYSAFMDIEEYQGRLWGVMKCALKEPLNREEIDGLKEYAAGQFSNGAGEIFEQRELRTGSGELCVHFWHSGDDYRILTEQELKGRQMEKQHKPRTKKYERAR